MPNVIESNARVFIGGKTGCGKSFLAETYLTGYEYVIKLDTKDETSERIADGKSPWKGLKEGKDFTVVYFLDDLANCETKKIIYVPDITEQNKETFDAFFKFVYMRENTVIWIDELMSISTSPLNYPFYMKACYTRGRSKNIGIWALSQRPSDIPAIVLANTEIFIVFALRLLADREKISKMTGCPEMLRMPTSEKHPYAFWYYEEEWNNPVLSELS